MKKTIIAAIIVAAIAIPAVVYAVGPLFINTTIDEAAPVAAGNETMDEDSMSVEPETIESSKFAGSFIGVGDGIHDAQGSAKVIPVSEGSILRLEDFRSTNGPDLYV